MSLIESEIDRYTGLYQNKKAGWHRSEVNPILRRYTHLLPQNVTGSPPKCILVPLCGKTLDIPYLLSLGYRVIGIEAVSLAIEELGTENSLHLEYDERESVYSTAEKNLIIFHGDFFKCPIEKWGPVDVVYDRGSFSVFTEDMRSDYVQVIRRALKGAPEFRYLLLVYDYDKAFSKMPPRATTREDIETNFGSWCQIQELESTPVSPGFLEHNTFLQGVGDCKQLSYMFSSI